MKIYKNDNGDIVVDGDGITTMEIPEDVEEVSEWLDERFRVNNSLITMGTPKDTTFIITGFIFKKHRTINRFTDVI